MTSVPTPTGAPGVEDDIFRTIDFSGGVLAAVSGGGDSTALLVLLKRHLDDRWPGARLLAVTVDHALRPGSAAEARAVADLCAGLGIAHRTLTWTGPKPASGLAAAAREARYRLLANAAREAGTGMIVTGHTADDQAETTAMRGERGEGPGLAGMATATLYDWRTWIVRPLLGTRRQALRDLLVGAGVGWSEDPTNADKRFERPRARAALASGGQARFIGALDVAAASGRARETLGRRAAALIGTAASQPSPGLYLLSPDGLLAAADPETALHALRLILAAVGGVPFLPQRERSAALLARLAAGRLRATLSRTVVDARRAGIFLHREARGLPPASSPVDGMIWDGRRRITLRDLAPEILIAPHGASAVLAAPDAESGVAPSGLARAALATEPAPWLDGRCLGLAPDTLRRAGFAATAVVAPFARFLPSFDLAPAGALAELLGAPPFPAMPLRRHDDGAACCKP